MDGLVQLLFLFHMSLTANTASDVSLVVPRAPIAATTGQDVLLPCYLSSMQSAVSMEIRWFRRLFTDYVYRYSSGASSEGRDYKGRVTLFPEELQRGNVSLLLKNVQLQDDGDYKCHVSHGEKFDEPLLRLEVRQRGSQPIIEVLKHNRDSIQMSCSSDNWYPKPHLLWMNNRGRELQGEAAETNQNAVGGAYSILSQLKVNRSEIGGVRCIVEEKSQQPQMESQLRISDEFFWSTMPDRVYISAFIIPMVIGLGLIVVAVLMINNQKKVRRAKLSNYDALEEEHRSLQKDNKALQERCDAVKYIPDSVWRFITGDAEDVVLDPDTAHPKLSVAEDGKSVSVVSRSLSVSQNSRRFEDKVCVVGKKGFSSGRHYWQVDVQEITFWYVGVGKENKDDKEMLSTQHGYWLLHFKQTELCAEADPSITLPASLTPSVLGVYVDCEQHQVSFYNVDQRCHIYTFTGVSCPELFPVFGTNAFCTKPISIKPVGGV